MGRIGPKGLIIKSDVFRSQRLGPSPGDRQCVPENPVVYFSCRAFLLLFFFFFYSRSKIVHLLLLNNAMPPVNPKLAANVRISVHKRFIKDSDLLKELKARFDWTPSNLSFPGRTVSSRPHGPKSTMYGVVLDDAPDFPLNLTGGCLKYQGPLDDASDDSEEDANPVEDASDAEDTVDQLEDAEESEEELDLTRDIPAEDDNEGWIWEDTLIDSRLSNPDAFQRMKSTFNMPNHRHAQPFEYFLYFLPQQYFTRILESTNEVARESDPGWRDISFSEYLMWIALVSVMVVVGHIDKKAYWKAGKSHFSVNVDFNQYMSMTRFFDIMRLHTIEKPSLQRRREDALYQIRGLLASFNVQLANALVPSKYLVVDESMNQWYGKDVPNMKKVPRKPHSIGQEFKTLGDHHTKCILQLDPDCDNFQKEFDAEYGLRTTVATVKRLVKPWFHSGRTVIADSWFGGIKMVDMLKSVGLYAIMMIVKRRGWPRGLPRSPSLVTNLGQEYGSHSTAHKITDAGNRVFACSYRDMKTKALVATCGTTARTGKRSLYERGRLIEIERPAVFSEYADHMNAVDVANNRRDNMRSYHDVITTKRWEMRFLAFVFAIAEANAFSCYKEFAEGGDKMMHGEFKDKMAYQLLRHCEGLHHDEVESTAQGPFGSNGVMPRRTRHTFQPMKTNGNKRRRLACRSCHENGKRGTRVQHCCSCNPDKPLCKDCHQLHAIQVAIERFQ